MKLAARVMELEMSPTLAVMVAAKMLKEKGVDVVDLGPGEPDFDTPEHIKAAIRSSLEEGFTGYTVASGIRELREAVARKYLDRWGAPCHLDNVVVTCGGKMALYEVAMAMFGPGDEVVIPAPYWVTFPEQVRLAGARPVIAAVNDRDFVLDAETLEPYLNDRTRAVIVNSPNNPTGAVIGEAGLRSIAELCRRRGVSIVADECYDAFVYPPERHFSLAALAEELGELLVICGSFSKTYAMTGHRLGYVVADSELIAAVAKLQSHMTSNPTSFVQPGGVEALTNEEASRACIQEMVTEYQARRDMVLELLSQIPNLRTPIPQGAFYLFPDFRPYLKGRIETSVDLATYLLEEGHVAVVPGSAFGLDGYARLSYATSRENLKKGIEGMARALSNL